MSVDFYECDMCYESLYEGVCYHRVVDGNVIKVCDYCIDKEIKKGNLIVIDEESAEYEMLSDEDKENVNDYGRIYRRTNSGVDNRLKEIDSQIEELLREKENLLKSKTL